MILNSTLYGHCPEISEKSFFGCKYFFSTKLRARGGISFLPFTTHVIEHIKRKV